MKILSTIIMLFITWLAYTQTTLKKTNIDSGGDSVTRNTVSVIYTIGEISVQERKTGTILASEGFLSFQSLFENKEGIRDIETGVDVYNELKIYPNPTADLITIDFSQRDTYNISVFDYFGKQILQFDTDEIDQYIIDFKSYSSGVYLILITGTNQEKYKTYRILKE